MKRRALTAAALSASLVLAACGGGDDTEVVDSAVDDATDVVDSAVDDATEVVDSVVDDATDVVDSVVDDAQTATSEVQEMTDTTEAAMTEVPENWPEELVFTLTPSAETGGLIETAEPLAAMLEERLGVEVTPLVPTDYAGVIVALQSNQAQIAGGLGPLQMIQAEEEAGANLILQAERYGSLTYVTQWMTNDPDTFCEDEPVADEDGFLFCNGVLDAETGPIGQDKLPLLEGQTIAFVDRGSTSGYAIPALQLANAGVDPIDGIEAVFAGGHDQAVQAVYDGDALVGTSFNDARSNLVETVPDVGEKVVVWGWSGPIPNDGFAVSGELPADLQQAITDAFVDITEDEAGLKLLSELYEIDDLVPVTSSDYDVIRELQTELGDVLG